MDGNVNDPKQALKQVIWVGLRLGGDSGKRGKKGQGCSGLSGAYKTKGMEWESFLYYLVTSLIIPFMKTFLTVTAALLISGLCHTQTPGAAINPNGALPDPSSILDVNSSSQGLLIPLTNAGGN